VVVAGGGVAGSAAAAALSQLGHQVAIVEPGIDGSRRLAGELVHDTGAAALQELGLLKAVCGDERSEIAGFSVRFGGSPDSKVIHLSYSSNRRAAGPAFAMTHEAIRQRMLTEVSQLPGVTVLDRARITAADLSNREYATVTISSQSGETVVRPRLLVGADGASSPVSRLAGMVQSRRPVSTIFGFLLEDQQLPDPGYGHVFLGASGPVLAYPVSKSATRIMFDIPHSPAGPGKAESCRESLHAVPEPLRSEVSKRLKQPGIVASVSYTATVREISRGRLVLVGDAAGCCHPLTATGLTVCARDAVRLRDALRDTDGDIERALPLYAHGRRSPQRTRLVLARALYEVFCAQTPESRLMRDGLLEYWSGSCGRRAKSMALLSTEEDGLRPMLAEAAQVMLHGLGTRISEAWRRGRFFPIEPQVLWGLSRLLLRHASETLRTG
jgi:2-polyprenyl-6-methoxyphenol hydroxylase-like FAD-dependent oxidoreductase